MDSLLEGEDDMAPEQDEKQGEKGKGLDEKYRRNALGFVSFALLVIWLGIALLLRNSRVIDNGHRGWALFVWGGGAIILVETIWLGVGFGLWFDRWELIGPLVIIAIGVAILAGRLVPRR